MSFDPVEQCVFRKGGCLTRRGSLGSALLSRRPSLSPFQQKNCKTRNCAQPCCAFCISEALFGSMTPVQLLVTAFNTDPSNVCSCVQGPGLLKPSKEQRMHLGKHSRRSMVGQGQKDLPNADRGGCSSCHKSASSWTSLAMVY